MTNDRDPTLQALFDSAKAELTDDAFVERVMTEIDAARRRTVVGWSVVGLVVAVLAWFFATPVQDAVGLLAQLLPESLIEVEDEFLAQLLSPVNSVAVPIALGFLALRMLYKKIF
jgi:hypothetical protein